MRLHRASSICALILVLVLALCAPCARAQAPRGNARARGRRRANLAPVQPGSSIERARGRTVCQNRFRTLDGVCTNPFFKLWGSTGRAQSSLFFSHSSRFPTGTDLPSARFISNSLNRQSIDNFNDRNLNEMIVFFGQFVDHTFTATPGGDEEMPIPIPRDDPIFANFTNGELPFTRSSRARVDFLGIFGSGSPSLAREVPSLVSERPRLGNGPGIDDRFPSFPSFSRFSVRQQRRRPHPNTRGRDDTRNPRPRQDPRLPSGGEGPNDLPPVGDFSSLQRNERPINSLTSALDLSSVYGVDTTRNNALRTFVDGKLKVGPDNLLPLNVPGLNNAPTSEVDFFLAGDHRANEHPVLTALHTIFVREHNDICEELKRNFPGASDEETYQNARKINGAQFQKIVFEQFYPALIGRRLPPYTGFKFFRNPSIIDVFSTAAFRVGHTMVGNGVSRRGPGNSPLPSLPLSEMFFRHASEFGDLDEFVRGSLQTKAQEIDLEVRDALRNFLFTGIPEEEGGFDLVALNLQRGRDHALPSLVAIQRRLGLRPARRFADISRNPNVQSALQSVYGTVDKVEAWIGLVGEDHVRGSSMGRTMIAVWERQFLNLRDGDRFFFRNNIFSNELRAAIPRIDLMFTNRDTFRDVLLRTTNLRPFEITARSFFTR